MATINQQFPPVTVRYDGGEKRFTDPYAARRFYVKKAKEGKSPKVCK